MYNFAPANKAQWNVALERFGEANFLQSWQWFDVYVSLGMKVVRTVIYHDDTTVGCIGGIVRDARRGRYLEVPGGPLIDWTDETLAAQVIAELTRIGREHNCVFIRIRPQLADLPRTRNDFAKLGFRKAPMHLHAEHTSTIDITPSEETLLANMRQQTRYEIKRAPKRGVSVQSESSEKVIETFYDLQQDTAKRQGFVPPSLKLLKAYQMAFGDNLEVYSAWKNDQLLNFGLVIFCGQEAAYFEAASSHEARKEPGAYALIWQSIRDAKARRMMRYNLWGIAPNDDPHHRYHGVTTFKRGFGGKDITYLPAHDLVLQPARYQLNKLVETVRKKRRKL